MWRAISGRRDAIKTGVSLFEGDNTLPKPALQPHPSNKLRWDVVAGRIYRAWNLALASDSQEETEVSPSWLSSARSLSTKFASTLSSSDWQHHSNSWAVGCDGLGTCKDCANTWTIGELCWSTIEDWDGRRLCRGRQLRALLWRIQGKRTSGVI